ncbi:DUF1573 domain-containing protein [Hugenholtzia roseola]|uniref:Ig-like domain-containing protein n=1 Tax=Hugenholtzia roseola TaxID=1002 RepID=UPI00041F963B|nr:DUF1573 domain-containing protein [Hugenholtzia roseola]
MFFILKDRKNGKDNFLKNRGLSLYLMLLGLLFVGSSCEKTPFSETEPSPTLELKSNFAAKIEVDSLYTVGDIRIGRTQNLTFTLTNKGGNELRLGAVGVDNGSYQVVKGFDKQTLKKGERTTFTIQFTAQKGGWNATNVAFFSNDDQNLVFQFKIRFFVREAPELTTFGEIDFPEGINNFDFNDGDRLGTLFRVTMPVNDPNKVIDPTTIELVLQARFSATSNQVDEVVKRGFELSFSPDMKTVSYTFAARFGISTHIDLTAWFRLPTGEESNKVTVRFERPAGAN